MYDDNYPRLARWNPTTIQRPLQLGSYRPFHPYTVFSLKQVLCSHNHSHSAKQVCTFLSVFAPTVPSASNLLPHSLQNPMHPSRTNSNPMSSIVLFSANWYKVNWPSSEFTCKFSILLVYFYHCFYVRFPWEIVNFLKAKIMFYNWCIPSISIPYLE